MSLRSRFGNRNLERKLIHAIRVMAPTLLALSFAGVAHAQGTMDFSGAQTLKGPRACRASQRRTQITIPPPVFRSTPQLVFGKEALCGSVLSHFHGRLRDWQSWPRRMGRRRNPRKEKLGAVGCPSLDDHLRNGARRCGSGPSFGGRPSADRASLRLRIPDLWNARICLPLAAPRLAKPARNPTAAPRIVDGADRAEHKSSHPMELGERSQRASRPEPCRRTGV